MSNAQFTALANAMAADFTAQKRVGAKVLADILVEFAMEQCHEALDQAAAEQEPGGFEPELDWDDEQTVEVLEAAIAIIKRRHRLAREV